MSCVAMVVFIVSNAFLGLVGNFLVSLINLVTSEDCNVSWLSNDIN